MITAIHSHLVIFYLHLSLSIAVLLYFISTYTKNINDRIHKWFPRNIYFNNEKSIRDTGQSDKYFVEWKYPDLFTTKNIIRRYSLKKEIWGICLAGLLLVGIAQIILHVLFDLVIKVGTFRSEEYLFITTCILDFAVFMSCATALIGSHINTLKNELHRCRQSADDKGVDQLKDLQLEGKIAVSGDKFREDGQ